MTILSDWKPKDLIKWRGERTQTEAAKDIGMSLSHYQNLEYGVYDITLQHELACEGWSARQRRKGV